MLLRFLKGLVNKSFLHRFYPRKSSLPKFLFALRFAVLSQHQLLEIRFRQPYLLLYFSPKSISHPLLLVLNRLSPLFGFEDFGVFDPHIPLNN